MEHKFTHATKKGFSGGEYVIIYCEKCGIVSYDQAKSTDRLEVGDCKFNTSLPIK